MNAIRNLMSMVILLAGSAVAGAWPVAFEGELSLHGIPADGPFDLRFSLYSGPDGTAGQALGDALVIEAVEVREGRFDAELDFGHVAKHRQDAWVLLEVARSGWGEPFVPLRPLMELPVDSDSDKGAGEDVPSGAVAFFDQPECPPGWTEYVPARGRAIVGLNPGGTLAGTVETALADLEEREHIHWFGGFTATTGAAGEHNHQWGRIQSGGGDVQWSSFTSSGAEQLVFAWSNGIGNDGAGIYPLAAQPPQTFYTTRDGSHVHEVPIPALESEPSKSMLPYIQLLACRKN